MPDPIARAEVVLRAACGARLRTNVPMAPLTTFRIGGAAALYLEPESSSDLAAVSEAFSHGDIPVAILGKGSNVLVSDRGFPGLVLRLGRAYRWAARDGDEITAGGAMPLPALAGIALRHELSGLEFGVAIPATLGGAVRMNAGAHAHAMADVVRSVEVFDLRSGTDASVPAEEAGFAYRRSALGEAVVVVGARLGLVPGDPQAIRASMDEARDQRRATQPLAEPNCGSVFKNPPDGHAAELVESAGLKGHRMGTVQVSTKHANFIVADPGGRADDVRRLIELIQHTVETRTGIRLEPEVQLIGAFDDVAH